MVVARVIGDDGVQFLRSDYVQSKKVINNYAIGLERQWQLCINRDWPPVCERISGASGTDPQVGDWRYGGWVTHRSCKCQCNGDI